MSSEDQSHECAPAVERVNTQDRATAENDGRAILHWLVSDFFQDYWVLIDDFKIGLAIRAEHALVQVRLLLADFEALPACWTHN